MTVADRAAEVIDEQLVGPDVGSLVSAEIAQALAAAGLLVTDDELELRTLMAEAERPDNIATRLRKLADTAASDPSWIGQSLDIFGPLFHEAAANTERLQALADMALRHVERVNAVVEAAKEWERNVVIAKGYSGRRLVVAVRALREDEG